VTPERRERLKKAGQRVREAPRPNVLERRMTKFLREPPSIRTAASVVVTATALAVVFGGIGMRVFDHTEYANVWVAMWWALQTVTTVGYGDVTPVHLSGRIIASFVMLEGIAFLAIVTAMVTSAFVARAQETRALAEADADGGRVATVEAELAELTRRFDDFEAMLRRIEPR
jgi:type VI protein secretion system component VasK